MLQLTSLLPQRLMSQLGLLLVSAIVIANLLAIGGIQLVGNLLSPAMRNLAVERIELAYLASQLSSGSPLDLQREDGARFWIAEQAEVAPFPMRREELKLRNALLKLHGFSPDNLVTFQLERTDGGSARWHIFSTARHDPLRLRSSVALSDGTFLNGIQPIEPAFAWLQLLTLSLIALAVPLLLLSLYFTNRVVRPIRRLAKATDAISRGEWSVNLPLVGPRESRDLTRSFNMMQQRLARHLEGQTRMLASMSHDFNTPLTELRLQIELLEAEEAREDMLESLNELQNMVSETLNFIRDETVQEQTCPCNLSQLIGDMCQRYEQRGHKVRWQTPGNVIIHCRPHAIKRALSNLIENALTYAGDATLALKSVDSMVTIAVMDKGPGIAEPMLDRAFEPFVRLEAQHAAPAHFGGGLGLGLSIARACAHAHGGELLLQNLSPTGLSATMVLPSGVRS
ncbi:MULTISPECIES: HAMP domain-containing sensor histidine kinase [Erwiniaceae]|uniref:sensor histidine kinase n=1 Tax=Erwiniaceae TaxID=1903409 RepID=UPI00190B9CB1|nr:MULTISPECIES: HAMP domain-containing sensor histidine kinase [Erwiniaceae]MBK0093281.1 HAMP domain-containing histidine kinase [Erwinia sp. S59]MBK0127730.1 HAMP domain-containing histidine kinase [Pantoea sp. S61]